MLSARHPSQTSRIRSDGRGVWGAGQGWRRGTAVHRWIAALLMVLFAVSSFESLIADVHDGDAPSTAGVVVQAKGVPTTVGTACVAVGVAMGATTDAAAASRTCDTPHAPTHDYHVCHCAHAHAAALSMAPEFASRLMIAASAALAFDGRMPASADRALALRPPVSLLRA